MFENATIAEGAWFIGASLVLAGALVGVARFWKASGRAKALGEAETVASARTLLTVCSAIALAAARDAWLGVFAMLRPPSPFAPTWQARITPVFFIAALAGMGYAVRRLWRWWDRGI